MSEQTVNAAPRPARRKRKSMLMITLRRLGKNKMAMAGLVILLLMILIALLSGVLAPYSFEETDLYNTFGTPSRAHPFGTDELGRDIFSRVVYGARVSLSAALAAVGLSLVIGIPLGAIAGSFGGWVDNLIMRITDVFLSFPPLLLAIAMVAVMGSSLNNAILAIALSWWPWYTRLIRGQAISVKERKFVQAAETIGTGRMKIIFKHIIPNCISPVIVQASMDIGGVILTVASLSFLGLGAQLPTPEWGLMISMGRRFFPDSWWYCIFPGLAIFVTVLCFNLLGDAIREILDPKTRKN